MASPSAPLPAVNPGPPDADPVAIRACLSQRLVVEFDAAWDVALEQAKASKNLAGVHKLLHQPAGRRAHHHRRRHLHVGSGAVALGRGCTSSPSDEGDWTTELAEGKFGDRAPGARSVMSLVQVGRTDGGLDR